MSGATTVTIDRQLSGHWGRRVAVLVAFLLVCVVGFRWLFGTRRVPAAPAGPPPRIDVPSPPDHAASIPHTTETEPRIATIDEMTRPWSAREFFYQNNKTGESVPALLIRLPVGSAAEPGGYWALSMNAPSGDCQLEYVTKPPELRKDYQFRGPMHPMIGNPCSRTVYDPLKLSNLPGNVWVRGGIVQGSDLRPPLGIELEVRRKEILAVGIEK